jgi:phosphate/sulfate permease
MIGSKKNVMEKTRNTYKMLLMLSGIVIGGGLGVYVFANTGVPSSLLLTNVGAAIGLAFGVGLDKTH